MMNSLKFDVQETIQKVLTNKDKHEAKYLEARIGWKEACLDSLRANMDLIEGGESPTYPYSLPKKPKDHREDYDFILFMLTNTTDDKILLDEYQVRQYLMDEWDWTKEWELTNTLYTEVGR